jgi:hypothetical protein
MVGLYLVAQEPSPVKGAVEVCNYTPAVYTRLPPLSKILEALASSVRIYAERVGLPAERGGGIRAVDGHHLLMEFRETFP